MHSLNVVYVWDNLKVIFLNFNTLSVDIIKYILSIDDLVTYWKSATYKKVDVGSVLSGKLSVSSGKLEVIYIICTLKVLTKFIVIQK